ncbi:hypothetical protein PHLCEN_2v7186 [Hermanssonia centrifuga]|uniref:Uncharacterized protein n=1 Tax=Hermanssonia centrifuga TaxID=98765 RepID=A0A2R6NX46_9APHY|nr:hypothetical protein PHLCEN_2v7186 [Hermanssonia centrifuga]
MSQAKGGDPHRPMSTRTFFGLRDPRTKSTPKMNKTLVSKPGELSEDGTRPTQQAQYNALRTILGPSAR